MFTNILIPVDLGHLERTDAMLQSVKEIVGSGDANITLLTVFAKIPGYIVSHIPPEVQTHALEDARQSLDSLAKRHGVTSTLTVKVLHGNPFQVILRTANDGDHDLVVIGSHEPGTADFLLGSVAGKVVRHAKCTVLVVR